MDWLLWACAPLFMSIGILPLANTNCGMLFLNEIFAQSNLMTAIGFSTKRNPTKAA